MFQPRVGGQQPQIPADVRKPGLMAIELDFSRPGKPTGNALSRTWMANSATSGYGHTGSWALLKCGENAMRREDFRAEPLVAVPSDSRARLSSMASADQPLFGHYRSPESRRTTRYPS